VRTSSWPFNESLDIAATGAWRITLSSRVAEIGSTDVRFALPGSGPTFHYLLPAVFAVC